MAEPRIMGLGVRDGWDLKVHVEVARMGNARPPMGATNKPERGS